MTTGTFMVVVMAGQMGEQEGYSGHKEASLLSCAILKKSLRKV